MSFELLIKQIFNILHQVLSLHSSPIFTYERFTTHIIMSISTKVRHDSSTLGYICSSTILGEMFEIFLQLNLERSNVDKYYQPTRFPPGEFSDQNI